MLKTTQEVFEGLHRVCDTKARTVKASRQELTDLLMDHSDMIARLEELGDWQEQG